MGVYDTNSDGLLDRDEAKKLLTDVVLSACEQMQKKMDALHATLKEPATVDHLLEVFDVRKDGKVTKEEFVAKAMCGFKLSETLLEPPTKKARTEAAPPTGTVANKVKAIEAKTHET